MLDAPCIFQVSISLNSGLKNPWSSNGIGQRFARGCEIAVVSAAAVLVIVSVTLAAAVLYALFFDELRSGSLSTIGSTEELQQSVEHIFAGILLLLLGLELLQSLTSFFLGHHFQLEIIVVVAMIAVSRHVMLMDFAHLQASNLLGTAALMLALAISYALVRQRRSNRAQAPDH